MRKNVKINDVLFESVLFVENGYNVMSVESYEEEFFGIYNVNISNKNIICESKSNNTVSCCVVIDNKVFKNVPFLIKKNKNNSIVINKNHLNEFKTNMYTEQNQNVLRDVEMDIRRESTTKEDIDELKYNLSKEKESLLNDIVYLKENIDLLKRGVYFLNENNKKFVNEKTFSEKINEHKQELLEEFFTLSVESKQLVNEKFNSIKDILLENVKSHLREENNKDSKLITENSNNLNEELISENLKNVKDLNKKVENFDAQISNLFKDKKNVQTLIQNVKNYTDMKVSQALEESKRFTRVMMDMVGGGSGSVSVQYAAGGTINGDLNVNGKITAEDVDAGITFSGGTITGDVNVEGTLNATTILSGGQDLTEIFAGEGGDDENMLNGGLF
jgi:RNase adaptor protein for sRNA GlmZ degradation